MLLARVCWFQLDSKELKPCVPRKKVDPSSKEEEINTADLEGQTFLSVMVFSMSPLQHLVGKSHLEILSTRTAFSLRFFIRSLGSKAGIHQTLEFSRSLAAKHWIIVAPDQHSLGSYTSNWITLYMLVLPPLQGSAHYLHGSPHC